MIYEGQDIISLFVKSPKAISIKEQQVLKRYYFEKGRGFVEDCIIKNKILPFAACVLVKIDCDRNYWKSKHNLFVQRNKKIKSMLNLVFIKMDGFGCKTLTLTENFGVVLRSDLCIGCFCSGDVDLSADINEKKIIESCLNSLNYFIEKPTYASKYIGYMTIFYNENIIPGGFRVNIMWKPVANVFLLQDKYDIRLSKDRLNAKLIKDTNIRVLEDTSLMYFCALHIASAHYYTLAPGIRLYVDIDRLARVGDINWDALNRWTDDDDAGVRVAIVMYLTHKLFKTPIPTSAYKKILKKSNKKRLITYLFKEETKQIKSRSNKLSKLYIELASDDKNLILACINRFNFKKIIRSM